MKEIILNTGDICQISDEDFDYLNKWLWCLNSCGRVHRIEKNNHILIQYEVAKRAGIIHLDELDHIDGNPLNNQRENLRAATKSENQANSKLRKDSTSSYKGVSYHKRLKKWNAKLQYRKVRFHLGYFDSEIEAAKAYDKAALHYFGEFANLNFKV